MTRIGDPVKYPNPKFCISESISPATTYSTLGSGAGDFLSCFMLSTETGWKVRD